MLPGMFTKAYLPRSAGRLDAADVLHGGRLANQLVRAEEVEILTLDAFVAPSE